LGSSRFLVKKIKEFFGFKNFVLYDWRLFFLIEMGSFGKGTTATSLYLFFLKDIVIFTV
jgi:hypothetical protein